MVVNVPQSTSADFADHARAASSLIDHLLQDEGRTSRMPAGWRRIREDSARGRARAMDDAPARAEWVRNALTAAEASQAPIEAEDRVLSGILRRMRARAKCTCQRCGRAGKDWQFTTVAAVLCPRCAAPHAIVNDTAIVERLLELNRRSLEDIKLSTLPVRLRYFLERAEKDTQPDTGIGSEAGAEGVVSYFDLERLRNRLDEVRRDATFATALRI